MNLRSFDLNLLVILDALLDEAHVTRAADRLGLSQPATSAALQRCRHLFGDELLERGRGTMRLTARAEILRAPLKSILGSVTDLIDPPRIPLSAIQKTLRITMADYPALLIAGPLQRALQETAPGISFAIHPWHGAEATFASLVNGATDLAISVFQGEKDEVQREELFVEDYVVAMRQEHPALPSFDVHRWLAFPHIIVSGRGDTKSPTDTELARIGLSRRVGLVVPSFGMVPELLRGSDMIAMLPSRVAQIAPDLAILPTPIPIAGFPLHLAWHRRQATDPALRHVAQLIMEVIE